MRHLVASSSYLSGLVLLVTPVSAGAPDFAPGLCAPRIQLSCLNVKRPVRFRGFHSTRLLPSSPAFKSHRALPAKVHRALQQARALYSSQQYAGAAAIVRPLSKKYPNDLYLLEVLGRSVYKQFGADSRLRVKHARPIYLRLVGLIDKAVKIQDGESKPRPDLIAAREFIDAYWKLGTLHLAARDFAKAEKEITRALYAVRQLIPAANAARSRVLHQMVTYLAEVYHGLGLRAENHYYVCQVLIMDPSNRDIFRFLLK